LLKEDIFGLIDNIASNESLKINDIAKEALFTVSEGDCRRVENILQSCAAVDKNITEELIYSLASFAQPKEIKGILETSIKGDFLKARKGLLDVMLRYGLSGLDLIKQIQKEVWNLDLENRKKVSLVDKCGEIDFRMVECADEFVQLEDLLAYFSGIKE
jgi:replication factor C small subunit